MRIYLAVIFYCLYSCSPKVEYPLKGYSYPAAVSAQDTTNYIFPLKDSLSTKDSLEYSDFCRLLLTAFGEPNLSIRPQPQAVYRLLYSSVMDRSVVITLREDQITIKEQTKGYGSANFDTARLSEPERLHYLVLNEYFPLQEVQVGWKKRYVDSLAQLYPQLLDVAYYERLRNKAVTYGDDPFTYKTETIPISKSTYARLANAINASGFWDEPFYRECDNLPTDAGGFTLEVNTPSRYKVVEAGICPGYIRRFHKAWQKVVDYIKKGNRLSLVWKDDVIRVD